MTGQFAGRRAARVLPSHGAGRCASQRRSVDSSGQPGCAHTRNRRATSSYTAYRAPPVVTRRVEWIDTTNIATGTSAISCTRTTTASRRRSGLFERIPLGCTWTDLADIAGVGDRRRVRLPRSLTALPRTRCGRGALCAGPPRPRLPARYASTQRRGWMPRSRAQSGALADWQNSRADRSRVDRISPPTAGRGVAQRLVGGGASAVPSGEVVVRVA